MEDDEFDDQLATLDLSIAGIESNQTDENANQPKNMVINRENTESQATQSENRLPSDNFELSDEQLATIDLAIADCIHRNNEQTDQNQSINEQTMELAHDELGEDMFGEFTDTQFLELDRAIEQCSPSRKIDDRRVHGNLITESQCELAIAALQDDEDENEPSLEHLECLRSNFGHTHFRTKQWEIIQAVMNEKRDVIAVMATGYGKSLCFQFPAVYKRSTVLVISPLIALMEAQVMSLNNANIPACLVGSAQPDKQIISRIKNGQQEYRLIYSSPEFLQGYQGKTLLHALKDRLTLIAIDESHCLSAWGLDFRPDFRRLDIIRAIIPNVPILALTATATAHVRYDIRSSLHLTNAREILTSFDRPNLNFIVRQKSDSKWNDLRPWVLEMSSGSVIIYVLKRAEADGISNLLKKYAVNCAPYHAGMPLPQRKRVLEDFLSDKIKVIVATIAFGMGIDKRDIRTIVHYGASKNLESYYQEVGRAGRDGLPSKVITYFEINDFVLHDWFLEKEDKKEKLSNFVKKFMLGLALHIREFVYSTKCRRKIILDYFGEDTSALTIRNDCCDNCASGLSSWRLSDLYYDVSDDGIADFSKDALLLFAAIKEMQSKRRPTVKNGIVNLIRGEGRLYNYSSYGTGRIREPYYWDAFIDQLLSADYLEFIAGETGLMLGQKAQEWMMMPSPKQLRMKAAGSICSYFKRKPSTPITHIQWRRSYSPQVRWRDYSELSDYDFMFCDY